MQRLLDILLSFMFLVAFFPLLLPVVIILRLTGEGKVFYVQNRAGRGGKPFGLYKFATMLKNSPNIGAGVITLQNDPRVLPFGKILRKTKINELPQLWNIFIGDMSLVGPRPMVLNTYAYYSNTSQQKLNTVRPGLTGLGSIVFRDEEKYLVNCDDPIEFYRENIIPYKSELEIWFVENKTIWLYIKIIFITAWVVFFPSKNISEKFFTKIPKLPNSLKLKD